MFVCTLLSLFFCLLTFYNLSLSLSSKTCKLNHNYADILESSMEGLLSVLPGLPFLRDLCLRVWLLPQIHNPFLCLASWFQSNVLRFDVKEPFLFPCRCKITICLSVCSDLSGLCARPACRCNPMSGASHLIACIILYSIHI